MISLVFLDFNKDSLKDSSKQAISFSNLFNEKVYGITDVNDKDYLSTLGSNGLDKIFVVKNLEDIKSYIDIVENNKIDILFFQPIIDQNLYPLIFQSF